MRAKLGLRRGSCSVNRDRAADHVLPEGFFFAPYGNGSFAYGAARRRDAVDNGRRQGQGLREVPAGVRGDGEPGRAHGTVGFGGGREARQPGPEWKNASWVLTEVFLMW